MRVAVIENAADVEEGARDWLYRNRQMIGSHGFNIEYIDLKQYSGDIESFQQKITTKDALWFGGGNIYYLRWLIHDMGIENILKSFADEKVYGGGSAGSIVVGPTLEHFETADDPSKAPEVLPNGLNFTNKVVLPHMDSEKYAPIMEGINRELQADGYQTVLLTDAQALVINGSEERIV